jgi:hypothetical protein
MSEEHQGREQSMSSRLLITVTCALALSSAACVEKKENREKAATAASTTEATLAPMATTTTNLEIKKVGLHQNHKPSIATIEKAKAPKPPANAKRVTTIGKGRFAINRANQGYAWTEEVDYDNDGIGETADYYYDPVDKITYLNIEKNYTCADGINRGKAGMLIAIYGKDNKWRKPAGSGWYLVELDAGECNARTAALWGCKLNANGEATECGIATTFVDDIAIIESTVGGSAGKIGAPPKIIIIKPIAGEGASGTRATPRR